MEVERTYRTLWKTPPACCRCGEPSRGGKTYAAAWQGRFGNATRSVESKLKIDFPVCDRCAEAQSGAKRAVGLGCLVGVLLFAGLFALSLSWDGNGLLMCGALLLALVILAVGGAAIGRRIWDTSHDEDMQRRAQLPDVPVTISPVGAPPEFTAIVFTFANDGYGEMFGELNPDAPPSAGAD